MMQDESPMSRSYMIEFSEGYALFSKLLSRKCDLIYLFAINFSVADEHTETIIHFTIIAEILMEFSLLISR